MVPLFAYLAQPEASPKQPSARRQHNLKTAKTAAELRLWLWLAEEPKQSSKISTSPSQYRKPCLLGRVERPSNSAANKSISPSGRIGIPRSLVEA